mmetsp:Transcript_14845/g.42652  ORF Transcript_14845/g.42652 Transcript_14845/m.42652 type:complete len:123 (-) Transcript_14845:2714-3082(-)
MIKSLKMSPEDQELWAAADCKEWDSFAKHNTYKWVLENESHFLRSAAAHNKQVSQPSGKPLTHRLTHTSIRHHITRSHYRPPPGPHRQKGWLAQTKYIACQRRESWLAVGNAAGKRHEHLSL